MKQDAAHSGPHNQCARVRQQAAFVFEMDTNVDLQRLLRRRLAPSRKKALEGISLPPTPTRAQSALFRRLVIGCRSLTFRERTGLLHGYSGLTPTQRWRLMLILREGVA